MTSLTRTVIDCAALRHNLDQTRSASAGARVMAVIKANGYGHGAVTVAQALYDADSFAVARVDEARALRNAGIRKPIVVLSGVLDRDQLAAAVQFGCEIVIHSDTQLELIQAADGGPFTVWLKIDTGMNRLGFSVDAGSEVFRQLSSSQHVSDIRLMTHLANADRRDDSTTVRQIEQFTAWAHSFDVERSIANSAGILGWPGSRAEWVRPGLMLYGVSPFADMTGDALGLRPVMRVQSRLIALKTVAAGGRVGYGGTWEATAPTRIGIAGIGYGDGYPWHCPSGTPVHVAGRNVPLVGRVSMDMIAIDLSEVPTAQVGDQVVVWGLPELPVEEVAAHAGTIPYEILCGITGRVEMDIRGRNRPAPEISTVSREDSFSTRRKNSF